MHFLTLITIVLVFLGAVQIALTIRSVIADILIRNRATVIDLHYVKLHGKFIFSILLLFLKLWKKVFVFENSWLSLRISRSNGIVQLRFEPSNGDVLKSLLLVDVAHVPVILHVERLSVVYQTFDE